MTQIMSKGVGIDLGTTNSVVAVMNQSDTEIVLHRDGSSRWPTTPSCVWRDPDTNEIHVGRKAAARTGFSPAPVRSVKRLMGSKQRVPLGREDASPEEVSACILAEMKRQIEEDVCEWNTADQLWIVDRAIVTVPAHFDQPQIDATREAAEQAGIELLDLLHEPTAAACFHCWRTNTKNGTFLVYDLGGGTFDVSIVRATAGMFEILGISGNTHLGGDDIDMAMANAIAERLCREGYAMELDPASDPADQARFSQLRQMAERTKKALSAGPEHALSETIVDKNGTPVLVDMLWDRSDFEDIARPTIELTLHYCTDALELANAKAGITIEDIDQIILAGGSTHVPMVRDILASELCSPASGQAPGRARCSAPFYQDVDTIVALGAAIRAAETGGVEIYDDNRTVKLALHGTGSLSDDDAIIGGTVTPLVDGLHVEGGQVRLIPADDPGDTEEALIISGGVFSFADLPIEPGRELDYTFEIFDAAGDLVATLGRRFAHLTDDERKPGGGPTSISKLSKPLLLEVDRQGRPHRRQLIPAMADLPVSADFEFSHQGEAEAVLFPIFQRRKLIQVIQVPVPAATPAGTPVLLNVSIDQFAQITVRGTIGDIGFDAAVEQPPDRQAPTSEEIRDLEQRFRETAQYLPTGKRTVAEARWEKTRQALEAAIATFDDTRAVYQYEELEDLVDIYERADNSLDPPKTRFDQLVSECKKLNESVRKPAAELGFSHEYDDLARNIEVQREHGEQAFREADQSSYAEAVRMLENIRELLSELSANIREARDTRTPAELATDMLRNTERLAGKVRDLAEAAEREQLLNEVDTIRGHLEKLREEIQDDPVYAQHKIDQHYVRLTKIKEVLETGSDDSAKDGVLVQDRTS